jgi:Response regulator containing a CheY-like receiver domain and an HTH DNA-binding domain
MSSILLFDDYGRYMEKWMHHTCGTLLATMTGVSFHAAKAHSRTLGLVDRILDAQGGRPVDIVTLVKSGILRESMEKLAVSHNARRLPLDVFLMGFKIMKLCTLEMILESAIEGKDTLALESGKVFEAMECVMVEAYYANAMSTLQHALVTRMKRTPSPKRDICVIKEKDRPVDPRLELTQAEYSVSKLIVDGLGTKDIAAQLNIAESTVHTHRKRIRNKLCVPGGQNLYAYLKNYEF